MKNDCCLLTINMRNSLQVTITVRATYKKDINICS